MTNFNCLFSVCLSLTISMYSIAILGFFSLVVFFFFTGRNDFGLKPTPKNNISDKDEVIDEKMKLEEFSN